MSIAPEFKWQDANIYYSKRKRKLCARAFGLEGLLLHAEGDTIDELKADFLAKAEKKSGCKRKSASPRTSSGNNHRT